MVEQDVYSRLQSEVGGLVDNRVYPVTPTENTDLPFIVYSVTSTNPNITLQGQSSVTSYSVSIDAYALEFDTAQAIAAGIQTAFHGYREQNILLALLTSGTAIQEELGFHYSQEITIYAT